MIEELWKFMQPSKLLTIVIIRTNILILLTALLFF